MESQGHEVLKLIRNNWTFSTQVDSDTALLGYWFCYQIQPLDLFVRFATFLMKCLNTATPEKR